VVVCAVLCRKPIIARSVRVHNNRQRVVPRRDDHRRASMQPEYGWPGLYGGRPQHRRIGGPDHSGATPACKAASTCSLSGVAAAVLAMPLCCANTNLQAGTVQSGAHWLCASSLSSAASTSASRARSARPKKSVGPRSPGEGVRSMASTTAAGHSGLLEAAAHAPRVSICATRRDASASTCMTA
jgi:hypothetical protein